MAIPQGGTPSNDSSQEGKPPVGSDEFIACQIVSEEDNLPFRELTARATPHGYQVYQNGTLVPGEVPDSMILRRRSGSVSQDQ